MSRGARLDRAGDEVVDEADDRRLARRVLQPVDVVAEGIGGGAAGLLEDLADLGLALAVEPPIGRLEIGRIDDLALDLLADREAHRLAGIVVEGVDHGEHERVAAVGQRQNLLVAQEGAPEPLLEQRRVGEIARRGDAQAQEGGQSVGEVLVRDDAEAGQDVLEPLAALGRDLFGARQRVGGDLAAREQMLREAGRPGGFECRHGATIQVVAPGGLRRSIPLSFPAERCHRQREGKGTQVEGMWRKRWPPASMTRAGDWQLGSLPLALRARPGMTSGYGVTIPTIFTTSKFEPLTWESSPTRWSLFQPSFGAPETYQLLPLSATIMP